LERLRDDAGRLLHRWRDGEAAIPATAADHACLAWGLIELYEATFEVRWLERAAWLIEELERRFGDDEGEGFFTSPAGATDLPVRQKEVYDGATPSANAVAWYVLLRLARLTGDPDLEARAAGLERAFAAAVGSAPAEHAMWLVALDLRLGPAHEVVVSGPTESDETRRLLDALRGRFLPRTAVLFRPTDLDTAALERLAPFVRPYAPDEGAAAAWVCTDFACEAPTGDPRHMLSALA
ncbi:MAG: thioredoxin domain-containing protein, partial [Gemmatimonadota bacterium]